MWVKKPDWLNCMSNHSKLSFHISKDESESALVPQESVLNQSLRFYLKWTSWRNFAVFCMDKALRESIQNEWDFKMLKYRGWMLGEMIYGPFVLPLEKDAHIFKIFMQFSSFKVASMHFIYMYVLHKQSLRVNSAYNLIAINNWSGLIIKTCTYMKSSKRKASKCHLKFSSLMMIFMKLVYLSSVISLK